MRKGLDLATLANELEYQNDNKRDLIVDTKDMKLVHDGAEYTIQFKEHTRKKPRRFIYRMTKHMLSQIAAFVRIPVPLIDRITAGPIEGVKALAKLITIQVQKESTSRLIRVTGSKDKGPYARAFLSDRYRTLDNYDLLQAVFPVINKYKGHIEVASCNITDTHLYLKLRNPKFRYKIGTTVNKQGKKIGDVIEAGVMISNSEVGAGALSIKPFITRLACENGAVITSIGKSKRKTHLGKQRSVGFDKLEVAPTASEILDDGMFWSVVQEALEEILTNEGTFKAIADRFKETKENKIKGHLPTVVAEIAKRYTLTAKESTSILKILVKSRDLTQFGLVNAVTRFARDPKHKMTYDRATELETIGGKILELEGPIWRHLSTLKEKPKTKGVKTPTRSF